METFIFLEGREKKNPPVRSMCGLLDPDPASSKYSAMVNSGSFLFRKKLNRCISFCWNAS